MPFDDNDNSNNKIHLVEPTSHGSSAKAQENDGATTPYVSLIGEISSAAHPPQETSSNQHKNEDPIRSEDPTKGLSQETGVPTVDGTHASTTAVTVDPTQDPAPKQPPPPAPQAEFSEAQPPPPQHDDKYAHVPRPVNPIESATLKDVEVTPEALNPVVKPRRGSLPTSVPCTALKSIKGIPIHCIELLFLRMFASRCGVKGSRKARKVPLCQSILMELGYSVEPTDTTTNPNGAATNLKCVRLPKKRPQEQVSGEVVQQNAELKSRSTLSNHDPHAKHHHHQPLSDITSDTLHGKISIELEVPYLSAADQPQQSPISGVLHGPHKRLMVNIVTRRRSRLIDGPSYPSFNVIFLCDMVSPNTYLCQEAMEVLLEHSSGNSDATTPTTATTTRTTKLPESLIVKLADFPFAVEAHLLVSGDTTTTNNEVNILGMDVISQLRTTVYGKNLSFELGTMPSDL